MILKIFLKLKKPMSLPFNYQQKLNGFIYKAIEEYDYELFDQIHNNKLIVNGKPFKPFVFSQFYFPDSKIFKSSGFLYEGKGCWYVSSDNPKIIEAISRKLQKKFCIDNDEILVDNIQIYQVNYTKDIFQTMTPVCITNQKENQKTYMMSPEDENYIFKLKNNIIKKHRYRTNEEISQDDIDLDIIYYNPNGSLINYNGTNVKGYKMTFSIKAKDSVKETVATLGLGNFNCWGFGFCLPKT